MTPLETMVGYLLALIVFFGFTILIAATHDPVWWARISRSSPPGSSENEE